MKLNNLRKKKQVNKENLIEPTAKKFFPEFNLKDKYKVNSTILKKISRGFRKKIKKWGSIGHFLYQNDRQSQKIKCKKK